MRLSIYFIVILLFITSTSIYSSTSKATEHYLAGDKLLSDGKLDEAINEFVLALQFKPTSQDTKDKLIIAQDKKIIELRKQVFELETKRIPVPIITEPKVIYETVDTRKLPSNYTLRFVYDCLNNRALTFAQQDTNWTSFRGKCATWTLTVEEVFAIDPNTTEVWLHDGIIDVCAIVNSKADFINKNSRICISGDITERNYKCEITTARFGNYSSKEKIRTFDFYLTNCSVNR